VSKIFTALVLGKDPRKIRKSVHPLDSKVFTQQVETRYLWFHACGSPCHSRNLKGRGSILCAIPYCPPPGDTVCCMLHCSLPGDAISGSDGVGQGWCQIPITSCNRGKSRRLAARLLIRGRQGSRTRNHRILDQIPRLMWRASSRSVLRPGSNIALRMARTSQFTLCARPPRA
jgi:hypothetical protein